MAINTTYSNQQKVNLWDRKYGNSLTRGLTIAGLGFLSICILGFIFYFIFERAINNQNESWSSSAVVTMLSFGLVAILLAVILQFIVYWRWTRCSKKLIITTMSIYCFGQGIGFGLLFYTLKTVMGQYQWLPMVMLIFAIAGLMLLACGLIGYKLSMKAMLTFTRMLFWATMVFLFISLIFSIVAITSLVSNQNFMGLQWFYWFFFALGAFLSLCYLVWDISMLSKVKYLASDQIQYDKLVLLFGFKLLVDFINLIYYIARIVLILFISKK